MPTVFVRSVDRPRFHRNQDCRHLTKPPPKGTAHPVRTVELAELIGARPCLVCYPEAPRAKVVHRSCRICPSKTLKPCEHNGGVLVTVLSQTNYISLLRDPGDPLRMEKYVWPEQVWMHEPV
jgi:hypothetical protein